MSNKRKAGPPITPLPSPLAISKRYAAATGQREADPGFYPGKRLRGEYNIGGKQNSRANVKIVAEDDTSLLVPSVTSPVGYFDAAKQDFIFFPEYVNQKDHRALARHMRREPMAA